jgi:D-alanyl-lipoteichoic acid acyltransferase DltB (MBOAT superfamily)
MRDFKAGRDINVGGNVNISTSNSYENYTNEELFNTMNKRRQIYRKELKNKAISSFFILIILAVIFSFSTNYVIYNYLPMFKDSAQSFVMLFGVLAPIAISFQNFTCVGDVEKNQIEEMRKMRIILRERGLH